MTAQQDHQDLLRENLDQLISLDSTLPVLDLACGSGRNGLVLSHQRIPVVFADRSRVDLDRIEQQLTTNDLPGRTWEIDLELPGSEPLSGQRFGAILVFRYLHRPLFPALREAIEPGGLVVYETFTTGNRRFGRPNNPDFLLRPRELLDIFEGWKILHYFEGDLPDPDRSIAQLVARKPKFNQRPLDNDKSDD